MRKLLFRFSLLLPVMVLIISIIFFCIKGYDLVKKALASQEETIVRELTIREKQNIFLLENVGFERYKKFTKIFQCESGWEQTAVNFKSNDFGLAQVNEKTWDTTAKSLGLDYKNSWQDNILLARYIQDVGGWKMWQWSAKCWNK